MTWLIVEDDQAIRSVLKTMCDLWGFNHVSFASGFLAAEYLEHIVLPEPVPNVALLDIRLPGPWGHEIGSAIRKHPQLGNIVIFLMTAYELPGDEKSEYLRVSGADRLLAKPLPPMDELLEAVEKALEQRGNGVSQNVVND